MNKKHLLFKYKKNNSNNSIFMVKLIFIFLIIFYSFNIFAANIPVYDWSSIDQADTELPRKYNLSLSSGYSQLVISGIYYNGYNIFTDLLVLLSKRGLIGFGFRYENTSSTSGALQDPQAFELSTFSSFYGGLNLAYKISFSVVDFQLNQYAYYGLYNNWQRNTTLAQTTTTSIAPITTNILYGIGFSILFKIGKTFYFGPTAYYSRGYIESASYADSSGKSYIANTGIYETYDYNLTIGMRL